MYRCFPRFILRKRQVRNSFIVFCIYFVFCSVQLKAGSFTGCHVHSGPEIGVDESHAIESSEDLFKNTYYKTNLSFQIDKRSHKPFAKLLDEFEVVSLISNQKLVRSVHYDANSRINYIKNSSKAGVNQVCGNYERDGIFHSDAKMCSYSTYFSKSGEAINFKVEKDILDLKYLTSIYFHEPYYQDSREIIIEIPEWMDIEIKEFNFENYDIKRTESVNSKGVKTITFRAEELDSFVTEGYSKSISHSYPHLLILSKGYSDKGNRVNLLSSVDDLYQWYSSLVKKVNNDPASLKPVVDELIADKSTDDEKIRAIFYWVQDNIRYIAYEEGIAGYQPEGAHLVLNKRYGDCKGMANLTKQMLGLAGFDARLVWLGTNDIPYDYSIPSLAVDNHMICAVKTGDETFQYLDATEKFISADRYADRIQGRPVLIENGENFVLASIPGNHSTTSRLLKEQFYSIDTENLAVTYTGNETIEGEMKTSFLYQLNQSNGSKERSLLKSYLFSNDKNVDLSEYKTSDKTNRDIPLNISFNAVLENQVQSYDNELYLAFDFHSEFANFIVSEDRHFDLHFDQGFEKEVKTFIAIPKGFSVKYLPETFEEAHQSFQFATSFEVESDRIVYIKKIRVSKGSIEKADFEVWNQAIRNLRKLYQDNIIFSKNN